MSSNNSIYRDFVFVDRLVSPTNGCIRRRLTEANIKNFGFDSIEHLHELYTNFPTSCEETLQHHKKSGFINGSKPKTKKTECVKCCKMITNCNIVKHQETCNPNKRQAILRKECQYCGREGKSFNANSNHEPRCTLNPINLEICRNKLYKSIGYHKFRKLILEGGKRKHSQATKEKISLARKKFLTENPDKVPYLLNHYSKGPSFPEKYFSELLTKLNVEFESEFRIGLYSMDFRIGNVDLEIDGDQHYLDPRVVESDLRRNSYMEEHGYEVVRVRWSQYQSFNRSEKEEYIADLVRKLCGVPSGT